MNNDPAFPCEVTQWANGSPRAVRFPGMSLRDYYAAHAPAAPQWWWDRFKTVWQDDLSRAAEHESQWRFAYADAMLKQRNEP